MPFTREDFKACLDLAETVFNVARDLGLVILFVVLICYRADISNFLAQLNVSEVDFGIFKVDIAKKASEATNENSATADNISDANTGLLQVKPFLDSLAQGTPDPKMKEDAAAAASRLDGAIASLDKATSSSVKTYVTQQNILQDTGQSGANAASGSGLQGWVYVGEVDRSKQQWISGTQKIGGSSPPKNGDKVTFNDDLFVRADGPPGQFNQQQILGVIRSNSSRSVIADPGYSHAVNGGYFLWLKIKLNQ